MIKQLQVFLMYATPAGCHPHCGCHCCCGPTLIAPAVVTRPHLGALCTVDAHLGASACRGCLLLRSHIANCAGCADLPPPECLVRCRCLLGCLVRRGCLLGCLCVLWMPAWVPLCAADACCCGPTLPIAPAVLTRPRLGAFVHYGCLLRCLCAPQMLAVAVPHCQLRRLC